MRSLPVLRPGGDDGQQNGFFRRLEAMRFVWLGDDKGPGVGRLLTAPGEKSALPLHHVEHDAGRRRVRWDLLSRQEAEDDDAHRVGIVQQPGNGPVGRKFGLFQRIKHGNPPLLSFPSGQHHRIVSQRLTTPRTMPANCATLPVQRRRTATGAMNPMTIPAVAIAAIQKWAAAQISLCNGFPSKRGRMCYAIPKMIMMTNPARFRCVCTSPHRAPETRYRMSREGGSANRTPRNVPRTK